MIAPIYFEPKLLATKMDVGPSAAAMMPVEAASAMSKPRSVATMITKKMPNCAAAPKMSRNGLESRGPKSIMAPMPMKSSSGKSSVSMPMSKRIWKGPVSPMTPELGMFTKMVPRAHGHEQRGLVFLLDARYMRRSRWPS